MQAIKTMQGGSTSQRSEGRGEGREERKLRVSGWERGAGEGSAVLDRSGGYWGRG